MRNMKHLYMYLGLFITPIIVLVCVLYSLKITPFGTNSIWYIDLPAQMTMFYNHLYDALLGKNSLIYTWNYGMGTSFWATISYYLSSPLSILILLFPKSFIQFSILIIWMLKIGLSSTAMAYLLRKHFLINRYYTFFFSVSYALVSFSITYYFLPMWIDAVYLLPLAIAGIHNIIKFKNNKLFLFSLTILFFATFYISYMVGIFVFLYFVAELVIHKLGLKETINRIWLFSKSVILAFLFTSFITIPTYLQLKNNKYTAEDANPASFLMNPLDLYGYLFNSTSQIQNLSLYVGLASTILLPLYFLNKKYSVRERLTYGVLLFIMLYSMTNTFLNKAWHVFEAPNGAYYRYAFIVSFLIIIISVKALKNITFSTYRQLMGVALFNLLFLSVANKVINPQIFTLGLINKNILILIVYTLIIFILMNNEFPKRLNVLAKACLCLLILGDMGLNSQTILTHYTKPSRAHDWYNVHNPSFEKAITTLQSSDQSFYRTKIDPTLETSKNESLRYGYKGMSIYTSTGSAEHNMFLNSLGYPANTRVVSMENGLFLSDALFGFKYLVTTDDLDQRVFTKIFEEGNVKVYKINVNLPLGYMVNDHFMKSAGKGDIFSIQNGLINSSNNSNKTYYEKLNPEITLHSLEKEINNEGTEILTRKDNEPTIEAKVDIVDTRELYLQLDRETIRNFEEKIEVIVNDSPVALKNVGINNLIDLGVYEDESLKVSIKLKDGFENLQVPVLHTLNYTLVEQEIDKLEKHSLEVTDYSDTHVTGEVTVNKDDETLFLSIPYDENWKITVNDKPKEYTKIGNFIGIPLDQGNHAVTLEYVPKILFITMGLSGTTVLGYFLLVIYRKRASKKLRRPTH